MSAGTGTVSTAVSMSRAPSHASVSQASSWLATTAPASVSRQQSSHAYRASLSHCPSHNHPPTDTHTHTHTHTQNTQLWIMLALSKQERREKASVSAVPLFSKSMLSYQSAFA